MRKKVKTGKVGELEYLFGKIPETLLLKKEFKISSKRNVLERVSRGFIKTYKPVIDDLPYRIFDKMQDYIDWCNKKLPRWLGYGKTK